MLGDVASGCGPLVPNAGETGCNGASPDTYEHCLFSKDNLSFKFHIVFFMDSVHDFGVLKFGTPPHSPEDGTPQ